MVDYVGVLCMFMMFVCICPLDRGSMEGLVVAGVRVEDHYKVECTISGGEGGREYRRVKYSRGDRTIRVLPFSLVLPFPQTTVNPPDNSLLY